MNSCLHSKIKTKNVSEILSTNLCGKCCTNPQIAPDAHTPSAEYRRFNWLNDSRPKRCIQGPMPLPLVSSPTKAFTKLLA